MAEVGGRDVRGPLSSARRRSARPYATPILGAVAFRRCGASAEFPNDELQFTLMHDQPGRISRIFETAWSELLDEPRKMKCILPAGNTPVDFAVSRRDRQGNPLPPSGSSASLAGEVAAARGRGTSSGLPKMPKEHSLRRRIQDFVTHERSSRTQQSSICSASRWSICCANKAVTI
ncbi:unnamed protein product [Prorocentrum cordatum]|uniref:Uncharacterized protein n=1 Tax=Prorocentrum cordatum TaxID=2364126 RepID=A0ABN9VCP3_9DINO|nr:unnamed protein product [Polarella glacialis]